MNTAKQAPRLLPVFSLLFTATLWGIVWYPLRLLQGQGLAGPWSALISYGAALLVCSWILVRNRQQLPGNYRSLLFLSVAAGWTNVAFIIAVLDGTVVRVLLLFYLSPFWAVCLGWVMLGERLDGKSILVFGIAVLGAMVMLWDERIGLPWPRDGSDWLAVSAGFAFALSNVYVRKMQAVGIWVKSVSSWVGVVVVAIAWIVVTGVGTPVVSSETLLYAVLLGLCGFLVMTVTVQYGVTRMPIHRSAIILLFELVAGALSAMWLTDEVVLSREWVGGGMIIIAAVIAARIHANESP
ncbi:MAG: DMT family transporter [Thiohalobacterales bacterium]